jgi:3-phenylpropionate/trans-cinnamate dioxygenase ferredoxin subunit
LNGSAGSVGGTISDASGTWVAVGRVADLPPGRMMRVMVDRQPVLLANVGGDFYALDDVCGHQRAALSRGALTDWVVECPVHFAQFDVRSGKFLEGPDAADVQTYALREVDGIVQVKRRPW